MGVDEVNNTAGQPPNSPTNYASSSLYGVNKFKATLFMFIPKNESSKDENLENRNGILYKMSPFTWPVTPTSETSSIIDSLSSYDRCADIVTKTDNEQCKSICVKESSPFYKDGNSYSIKPEVKFRCVTIETPKFEINAACETLAVCEPPFHPNTRVVSCLEYKDHRRYKNQVYLLPALHPVKYSETHHTSINSTRKRFVNRVFLQPRLRSRSHSETVFAGPKTAQTRYETVLQWSNNDPNRKLLFKTGIEFQLEPRIVVHVMIPPSSGIPRHSVLPNPPRSTRSS